MLFVVLSTILHGVHLVLNYSLVQPINVVGNWYNGAKLEKPPVASATETAQPSADTEHEQTRATAPPVASVLKGRCVLIYTFIFLNSELCFLERNAMIV